MYTVKLISVHRMSQGSMEYRNVHVKRPMYDTLLHNIDEPVILTINNGIMYFLNVHSLPESITLL